MYIYIYIYNIHNYVYNIISNWAGIRLVIGMKAVFCDTNCESLKRVLLNTISRLQ